MQYSHSIIATSSDSKNNQAKTKVDVLVFDSGVGGLSIVEELKAAKPDLSICFVCDNEGFPYGTKDDSWLLDRVNRLFIKLLSLVNPRAIVIACNTASTIVLDILRGQTNIPIVGVVPAIKPAAMLTETSKIGLIATPATVSRPYTQSLVDKFAAHCQLVSIGSSRLVELAEMHLRGSKVDSDEIAEICKDFGDKKEAKVDVIVLGCTHFPLLKSKLQDVLPSHVKWIDSGAAIARQVFKVLETDQKPEDNTDESPYILTKKEDLKSMTVFLNKLGFKQYSHLNID